MPNYFNLWVTIVGMIDPEVKKALDLRLAKGEIDKEEYLELLEKITKSSKGKGSGSETKSLDRLPVERSFSKSDNVKKSVDSAREIDIGVKTAIASTKSYVGEALLAWILYYIGFYFVGFIVNLAYLASANKLKRETGITPSGKGCLSFLLFVHFWLPLIVIVLLLISGVHVFSLISNFLSSLF